MDAIAEKRRTVANLKRCIIQAAAFFGLTYLPALASTTSAKPTNVVEVVNMSMQEKSNKLAGAENAPRQPLELEITEPPIMALFTVIVAMLASIGGVIMCGAWYDALKPKSEPATVFYECTFDLGQSLLTKKCEVLGEWVNNSK